jgi:hypothetical protein
MCALIFADSMRLQTIAQELGKSSDPERARKEFTEATRSRVIAAIKARQAATARAQDKKPDEVRSQLERRRVVLSVSRCIPAACED